MSDSTRNEKTSKDRQLPLDEVLGTRANVRVLRVFHNHAPRLVWPSEIVDEARLSRAGVWNALKRLERSLLVEPVNLAYGRMVPYRQVRRHRMAEPLAELFRVESEVLWQARIAGLESGSRTILRSAFIILDFPPELPRLW